MIALPDLALSWLKSVPSLPNLALCYNNSGAIFDQQDSICFVVPRSGPYPRRWYYICFLAPAPLFIQSQGTWSEGWSDDTFSFVRKGIARDHQHTSRYTVSTRIGSSVYYFTFPQYLGLTCFFAKRLQPKFLKPNSILKSMFF